MFLTWIFVRTAPTPSTGSIRTSFVSAGMVILFSEFPNLVNVTLKFLLFSNIDL